MSFASVANTPATCSGLNYPIDLIQNGNNPTLQSLQKNKIWTLTTARAGGNTDIYLPEDAKIGDWIQIIYISGDNNDFITIYNLGLTPGSIGGIRVGDPMMFVYSPIPLGEGWIFASYF